MGTLSLRRVALAAAFVLLLVALATASELPAQGRVSWVDDGDTLHLASGQKVRLLGIDTPERRDSERDAFYHKRFGLKSPQLRRIARAATRRVIHLAKGKTVRLQYDHTPRDCYGRLLAYVTLPDGRQLNALLIDEGLASAYRAFDYRQKEDFLAREQRARQAGLGLWQQP